ncbi:MAG: hypothetical protein K2M65_06715, partial [Muribaculaceae bacterium]|nr:hypothetical protein [Muribaculaceae bacterium]
MKGLLHNIIVATVITAGTASCTHTSADRHIDAYTRSLIFDSMPGYNPYAAHFDSMPPGGKKIRISKNVTSLPRQFNDSNYRQLMHARNIGISPINGIRDCWHLRQPVVMIESCREYFVDELTHSYPFLVPEAAQLLSDIGARFNDSLQARGGGDYRIRVTSVLRTHDTVKRLRRRNINAIDSSAHRYATTFDISYVKFICDSANTIPRTQTDLKNLLAEVLLQLKAENRCLVKYERKQGCFHIT